MYLRRSPRWPDPRVKPPYGSVEPRQDGIASGLVHLMLLNEAAGGVVDLVRRQPGPISGTVNWRVTNQGLAVAFPTGSSSFDFGDGGLSTGNGNYSVCMQSIPVLNGNYKFAGTIGGTNTDHTTWGIDLNNQWWVSQRGVADITSTTTATTDPWSTVFAVTRATGSVRFHLRNLVSMNSYIETVASGSPPNTGGTSCVGNLDTSAGFNYPGEIVFVGIWNRLLNDTESLELHNDPYRTLLRPIIRRRYFVPQVAAAATARNVGGFLTLGVGT